MTTFLYNLVGMVTALGLMLAGLVYMLSPKAGCELFKRLAVFLIVAIVGLCLLGRFLAAVQTSRLFLFLTLAVVSVGAFLIREVRRSRAPRPPGRTWGAERTPLMPSRFDGEDR